MGSVGGPTQFVPAVRVGDHGSVNDAIRELKQSCSKRFFKRIFRKYFNEKNSKWVNLIFLGLIKGIYVIYILALGDICNLKKFIGGYM